MVENKSILRTNQCCISNILGLHHYIKTKVLEESGGWCLVSKRKILKSKADSDANMKQDLFEVDFQLCLSTNGLVEEQK